MKYQKSHIFSIHILERNCIPSSVYVYIYTYTVYVYSVQIHCMCIHTYIHIWIEFSGCGFKSHSAQLSIATFQNPSVVNTYKYIHHWRILRSSYRKLAWVGFEPTTTELHSDMYICIYTHALYIYTLLIHCIYVYIFVICIYEYICISIFVYIYIYIYFA